MRLAFNLYYLYSFVFYAPIYLSVTVNGAHNVEQQKFLNVTRYLIVFFSDYLRESFNKFPDFFFVWALLLIVHSWNSSPLRSNLLQLQCTCCTVPTTSARPHGSHIVRTCQWPSSQPLSSPQLSPNDSFWAYGIPNVSGSKVWTIWRLRNCLDAHLGQIVSDKDGVVDWCIVRVEMPLTRFE